MLKNGNGDGPRKALSGAGGRDIFYARFGVAL